MLTENLRLQKNVKQFSRLDRQDVPFIEYCEEMFYSLKMARLSRLKVEFERE